MLGMIKPKVKIGVKTKKILKINSKVKTQKIDAKELLLLIKAYKQISASLLLPELIKEGF